MGPLRRRILGLFLAALYVLSATTLGFAHVAMSGTRTAETPYAAAEYRLPDGSTPEICVGEADDEGGKPVFRICDACLLVSAGALVPYAPGVETIIRDTVAVGSLVRPAPLLSTRHLLIQQPRAPPSQI